MSNPVTKMMLVLLSLIALSSACQQHFRPIYNATSKQYISCNAWEPECASGSVCQLASKSWKSRLNVNEDYTLFLCCGDEILGQATTAKSVTPFEWQTTNKTTVNSPTSETTKAQSTLNIPWTKTTKPVTEEFFADNFGKKDPVNQPHFQPVNRVERPTSAPLLPPVPQIVLPGNGVKYDNPRITQLIVGQLTKEASDDTFKWFGTSTLIQDNGLNILVDTSSAQNKNKLIAALAQQGLKPQNIQIVIYTNAHPVHLGNDNVFPYAEKIFATFIYKGDEWITLKQFKDPNVRLTQNVEIWQTPGRSELHNSVIVRNVLNQGSVAISGNVFINDANEDDPSLFNKFAMDKDLLTQVRNLLVCQSDYIVPAYGSPFAVGKDRKSNAGCANKVQKRPTRWLLRRS